MIFRRRRFRDPVARQLALFAQEHSQLVERARSEMRAASEHPDPHIAQEHYAQFDEDSETIEGLLYDMCDAFSASLDADFVAAYVKEFDRQARAAYRDVIPRLNMLQRPDDDEHHELGFDEPELR